MTNAEKFETAEERAMAFHKWCNMQGRCDVCSLGEHEHCTMYWLELEAEEEKPLPCPFCGDEVETAETLIGKKGFSCSCGYTSKAEFKWDAAIAAHNRVARACAAEDAKCTS